MPSVDKKSKEENWGPCASGVRIPLPSSPPAQQVLLNCREMALHVTTDVDVGSTGKSVTGKVQDIFSSNNGCKVGWERGISVTG